MTADELAGLTLPELIDQLAGVEVPSPVAYSPETVGWWVLAGFLASALAVFAVVRARRRRRNRYRRLALAELKVLQARAAPLHDLSALVRRTALAAYPRDEIAHLYGADWRDFLNRSAGADLGVGVDGIIDGPYRPGAVVTSANFDAARRWIGSHRD